MEGEVKAWRWREWPAWTVSAVVHLTLLAALATVHEVAQTPAPATVLDTQVVDSAPAPDFATVLDAQEEAAKTLNVMAATTPVGGARAIGGGTGRGGSPGGSGAGGGGGGGGGGLVGEDRLPDVKLQASLGTGMRLPSRERLGVNLGAGMKGDVGGIVGSYGEAIDRITAEMLGMLKQKKLLVVWLFDESESMQDDQKEVKNRFDRIFKELGLADEAQGDAILTAVASFGKNVHFHTAKPTYNVDEIRAAIDKVPTDPSGVENTFKAVREAVARYQPLVAQGRRRLVLVVVTDESGDDGSDVEEAVAACRRVQAPVYAIGREAVFGYPYAHLRWIDPATGLPHWPRIRRGPESADVESLQYEGLHERWDAHSSGFGPYELTRLARETNGIFFMLPHEEAVLVDANRRKFEFMDVKEYVPEYGSRQEYDKRRHGSKLRETVYEVVRETNPYVVKPGQEPFGLRWRFPIQPTPFQASVRPALERAGRVVPALAVARRSLEGVARLRDKEPERRWQAAYDLALAQVIAYRVKAIEYGLALDGFAKKMPEPKDKKSTRWDVVDAKELRGSERTRGEAGRAEGLYKQVIERHPGTPWAERAKWELARGLGVKIVDIFWDERYDNPAKGFKVPNF